MTSLRLRRISLAILGTLALLLVSFALPSVLAGGPSTVVTPQTTLLITGQVTESNGTTPVPNVTITFTLNRMGTIETRTTQTDAGGNYTSGDLACASSAKVEPTKAGLSFTPQSRTFVSSSSVCGNQTAN